MYRISLTSDATLDRVYVAVHFISRSVCLHAVNYP